MARPAMVAMLMAATLFATPVTGEPFVPGDPDMVLERLALPGDQRLREIAGLTREVAAQPGDMALRARLARRYLSLGRAENAPRYFGRAQGSLGPMWAAADLPPDIMVLRAAIKRTQHDFQGSLLDLDQAVARQPRLAQAHLDRATTLEGLGEFAAAAEACRMVLYLRPGLLASACAASAASLGGDAAASYRNLAESLRVAGEVERESRAWAETILGEIAARRGDAAAAERHFRAVLAAQGRDLYVLTALADLLLDADRPAEVMTLLGGELRADSALLRWCLAAKRSGVPGAEPRFDELAARLGAAERRGDSAHLRDAAQFRLAIAVDAAAALELAERNWQRQRGPADARIVLEAAVAAELPDAAAAVLAWMTRTGIEDVALARLRHQLDHRS